MSLALLTHITCDLIRLIIFIVVKLEHILADKQFHSSKNAVNALTLTSHPSDYVQC